MSTTNTVALAKFRAVAAMYSDKGITSEDQTAWVKFTKAGGKGKAVYVAKTDDVNAVDVSGFSLENVDGLISHPKPPTKRVPQCIDFSQDEKTVLRAFRKAIEGLANDEIKPLGKNAVAKQSAPISQEEIDAAVLAACSDE